MLLSYECWLTLWIESTAFVRTEWTSVGISSVGSPQLASRMSADKYEHRSHCQGRCIEFPPLEEISRNQRSLSDR